MVKSHRQIWVAINTEMRIFSSFLLGLVMYFTFMSTYHILFLIVGDGSGYYSFWGAIIYGAVFAFWAFWLLSYIYIYITKNDSLRQAKYLKASVIVSVGYFVSRVSDIIDGHFFVKFNLYFCLMFILFVPLLVEIEILLNRNKAKNI